MRRSTVSSLLLSLLAIACDSTPAPTDSGVDAPIARADAGPPNFAEFADLGASSEGIALGTTVDGDSVLYVGTLDDRIVRVAPDGTVTDLVSIPDPLGIAIRADGELVVCAKHTTAEGGAAALFLVTRAGLITPLALTGPGGAAFGLTNFVAIAPDGSLVFSDSMANQLFRADADGTNVTLVTDAITYPNGLAFSPDGTTLYVASWNASTVHALSFDRTTSSYGAPAASIEVIDNVDGIVTTSTGALVLVTSSRGIVLGEAGSGTTEPLAPIRAITLPANGVFGDDAFGTSSLYVSTLGESSIYRIETELVGAPLPTP